MLSDAPIAFYGVSRDGLYAASAWNMECTNASKMRLLYFIEVAEGLFHDIS